VAVMGNTADLLERDKITNEYEVRIEAYTKVRDLKSPLDDLVLSQIRTGIKRAMKEVEGRKRNGHSANKLVIFMRVATADEAYSETLGLTGIEADIVCQY